MSLGPQLHVITDWLQPSSLTRNQTICVEVSHTQVSSISMLGGQAWWLHSWWPLGARGEWGTWGLYFVDFLKEEVRIALSMGCQDMTPWLTGSISMTIHCCVSVYFLRGGSSFLHPLRIDHQPDRAGKLDHRHPFCLCSCCCKTPPQRRHTPAPQVRNQKAGTEDRHGWKDEENGWNAAVFSHWLKEEENYIRSGNRSSCLDLGKLG